MFDRNRVMSMLRAMGLIDNLIGSLFINISAYHSLSRKTFEKFLNFHSDLLEVLT